MFSHIYSLALEINGGGAGVKAPENLIEFSTTSYYPLCGMCSVIERVTLTRTDEFSMYFDRRYQL